MSKKDDQILELTAEITRLENRVVYVGRAFGAYRKEANDVIDGLTKERDLAQDSIKDWRHIADAERSLRLRYKDAAEKLAVAVEASRLIVKVTNLEATRLSEEVTEVLAQL